MTNTANGFRNTAAEMGSATTGIDKIQNMAAVNIAAVSIVHQPTQVQAQMNRMGQNILRQLSHSYGHVCHPFKE